MKHNFGGFSKPGKWFKGNLHTHSTRSDGQATPERLADLYREGGYDFLAITDHAPSAGQGEVKSHPAKELCREGFLVLEGNEYAWSIGKGEGIHAGVVGPGYMMQPAPDAPPSSALRMWWDAGGFAWWAHPYWCNNSTRAMEETEFLPAFEIFNTITEVNSHKGLSTIHWDRLLGFARPLIGLAVDDSHGHPDDSLGGWVIVKAPALTEEAIVEALRLGDCYASCGPTINDIQYLPDGKIRVQCSPVREVWAISYNGKAARVKVKGDDRLTDVTLDWNWGWFGGEVPYVRIECIDAERRSAWSQAVMRTDLQP